MQYIFIFIGIVLFHNYFSLAVSTRTTYISLKAEQPTASCIAIFHKHCCYIKYCGIIMEFEMIDTKNSSTAYVVMWELITWCFLD